MESVEADSVLKLQYHSDSTTVIVRQGKRAPKINTVSLMPGRGPLTPN